MSEAEDLAAIPAYTEFMRCLHAEIKGRAESMAPPDDTPGGWALNGWTLSVEWVSMGTGNRYKITGTVSNVTDCWLQASTS